MYLDSRSPSHRAITTLPIFVCDIIMSSLRTVVPPIVVGLSNRPYLQLSNASSTFTRLLVAEFHKAVDHVGLESDS